jgi:C1A family cysteine protease
MSSIKMTTLFSATLALLAMGGLYSSVGNQASTSAMLAKPHVLKLNAVWGTWKAQHKKTYSNVTEENFRKEILSKELAKIELHNSNPHATSKMGLNHFSDLQEDEHDKYFGVLPGKGPEATEYYTGNSGSHPKSGLLTATATPTYYTGGFSYRDNLQVLNPIQDQGQCGSCWAFASTAV